MFTSFSELENRVKDAVTYQKPAPLIVACPYDQEDLAAIEAAKTTGLIVPILVGNPDEIQAAAKKSDIVISDWQIEAAMNEEAVAQQAVALCHTHHNSLLVKGQISTPILLKKVLDKDHGLRTGSLLSDLFIYENPFPGQERRMLCITDGGIAIAPDLEQKKQILENALSAYRAFGQDKPHVAIVSANEKPSEKMPSTLDAEKLVTMAKAGMFGNAVVEGPLGFDCVILKWCAERKHIPSTIAGNCDILLFPNIEAANITAKAIMLYLKPRLGHVLVGAQVPILINSRIEDADARYHSVLLAIYLRMQQNKMATESRILSAN